MAMSMQIGLEMLILGKVKVDRYLNCVEDQLAGASFAPQELLWLRKLLDELGYSQMTATV